MVTAFDKWWAEMVQRRPQLMNGTTKMTMSVDELKSNLKRAFDAGWATDRQDTMPNPFAAMFGRK